MKFEELLSAMGLNRDDYPQPKHSFPSDGLSAIVSFETVDPVFDADELDREESMVVVYSATGDSDEIQLGVLMDLIDPTREIAKIPSDYVSPSRNQAPTSTDPQLDRVSREIAMDAKHTLWAYAEDRAFENRLNAQLLLADMDDERSTRKGLEALYWLAVEAVEQIGAISELERIGSREGALGLYSEYLQARDSDDDYAETAFVEERGLSTERNLRAISDCLAALDFFLRKFRQQPEDNDEAEQSEKKPQTGTDNQGLSCDWIPRSTQPSMKALEAYLAEDVWTDGRKVTVALVASVAAVNKKALLFFEGEAQEDEALSELMSEVKVAKRTALLIAQLFSLDADELMRFAVAAFRRFAEVEHTAVSEGLDATLLKKSHPRSS